MDEPIETIEKHAAQMNSVPAQSDQPRLRLRKILHVLAAVAVALSGVLILTATIHFERTDFIEYRSSGKLLLHHTNPYSPAEVLALEQAHGRAGKNPLIMLNPPWSLFLVASLGLGSLRTGLFLWTLAAVGSVLAFCRLQQTPSRDQALAFLFAPVLACICSGQSSPFLLLGFSLFLRLHQKRPFLAGASLLFMAIKPHLFLIFWSVLLADCLYRRRFRILAGAAAALAVATAFPMYFDRNILQHWLATIRGYGIERGTLPTASMLFRMLIDVRAFWLLFVPSSIAIVWALWYYARSKRTWDWRIHGMLLMIVTILVSPYGFFSDEIVLLPSIAFALALPQKRRYSGWILLVINSIALYIVLVDHAALSSRAYLWTPFAWLGWFLYATRQFGRRPQWSSLNIEKLAPAEEAEA